MDSRQFVISLLQIVIAFISPLTAYALGRMSARHDDKSARLQMRFDNFYHPYVLFYLKTIYDESAFEDVDATKLLTLLFDKIHYASTKTQLLATRYLQSVFLNDDSDALAGFRRSEQLEAQLNRIVFEEYKQLCKQLRLPEPATPPLTILAEQSKRILSRMEQVGLTQE